MQQNSHVHVTEPVNGAEGVAAKKPSLLPAQIGTGDSADFDDMTWTFLMPEGYRVAAGRFAIVPHQTYHELREALEWMLDTFGDRSRLPKVMEAAAAIHKARSAIAATGSPL